MHRVRMVGRGTRARSFAQPEPAYTRVLLASALTPEPGLGLPDFTREALPA